jgi:predicted Zn-ribbon and HTH transcriptional regulator
MLDLITEEEYKKKRTWRDIDKDKGKTLRKIIKDKFLNKKECAEYFNCAKTTIGKRIKKYNIEYKQKSTKQFKWEVYQLVGDRYIVLGHYTGNGSNGETILMKHKKCGYEWKVQPSHFLNTGTRCPKCYGNVKRNIKEIKKVIYNLVQNEYTVLSNKREGKDNNHIELKHEDCKYDHVWMCNIDEFINGGTRCPKCAYDKLGNQKRKTTEEYKKDVKEKVGNRFFVKSKYGKTNRDKVLMQHNHKRCNYYEFEIAPNDFLSRLRCPKCSKLKNKSINEEKIENYLIKNNIEYEIFYRDLNCKNVKSLEFDFKIKNKNLYIEYDGRQHFEPVKDFGGKEKFEKQRKNDIIKNNYCKENNINLLRISHIDQKNINNILNEKINNINKSNEGKLEKYLNRNIGHILI